MRGLIDGIALVAPDDADAVFAENFTVLCVRAECGKQQRYGGESNFKMTDHWGDDG